MKYLIALAAVAVTIVTAMDFPTCERDVCKCPEPNKFPGDISQPHEQDSNNTNCVCTCGRKINTPCDNTDHCSKGTFCGAPPDITIVTDKKKGVCTDRCKITKCPAYHKCVIDEPTGEAQCECQKYKCISGQGKSPVYKAEQGGRIMNFESMCDAINTNCELKRMNADAKLWRFVADHSHDYHYGEQ